MFVINMKRAWQFLFDNLKYENNLMLLREYIKIVGELLFNYAGEIRTIPVQIGGTSWEPEMPARTQIFIDGNKRVAQLIANKVLIQNNIGIFQVPIEGLEEFKMLLIRFYESGNDMEIIDFMKNYCIRRIRG